MRNFEALMSLGDEVEAQDLGDAGFVLFQADEDDQVHTIHMTDESFERLVQWRRALAIAAVTQ